MGTTEGGTKDGKKAVRGKGTERLFKKRVRIKWYKDLRAARFGVGRLSEGLWGGGKGGL